MLIGEEPEVRLPSMPAVVMPIPEAIVRKPQQRRRYILKQGCGSVRTDARMRGLYSSGRSEATLRRMQGTHGRAHAA